MSLVGKTRAIRNCVILGGFDETRVFLYTNHAGWSSLVARRAHNPKVVSSNLTPATNP